MSHFVHALSALLVICTRYVTIQRIPIHRYCIIFIVLFLLIHIMRSMDILCLFHSISNERIAANVNG